MKIRPYEIVNYDKNVFTIRGEQGDQAEFISEYQLSLLQAAERNHNWAPVIFPDSGISTKSHQKAVVDLWQKMRRAGVAATTENKSLESVAPNFVGLHSLSATLLGILHRPFAFFTPMQIFFLLAVCLLGTILFFPMGANFSQGASVFPLALFIAGGYFTTAASLSIRSLLQVAGLRRLGRVVKKYRLSLAGPFIYLNFDRSEFLMVARRERIWLALVGVLSPFLLTFIFSLFFLAHWIGIASLAVVALFAALTMVVQLCPIYPTDGAVLLQMWQNPYQKENGIANELRSLIEGRIYFEKKMLPIVLFLLLSAWLYSDILNSYFSEYAQHLQGSSLGSFSRAIANLLLLAPLFLGFSLVLNRWRAGAKNPGKPQAIDLPVAEQLQALEKIPLFPLNSSGRLGGNIVNYAIHASHFINMWMVKRSFNRVMREMPFLY